VKSPVPIFVPVDDGMDKYDDAVPKNDKLDIYILLQTRFYIFYLIIIFYIKNNIMLSTFWS